MPRRPERIELKTPQQVDAMRAAGLVVARALARMNDAAAPGVSTADLDELARSVLDDAGATSSFLGYDIGNGPYPGVICASINDWVVHGIPAKSEVLADGDLVSIDFGAIVDGWHGDAAITVAVGGVSPEAAALSGACRAALWDGLAVVRAGARLTDISHAVERSVRRSGGTGGAGSGRRYGIVAGYGGHGIGTAMHMAPHILNYGRGGKGPRLAAGMTLAIEPMVTMGSGQTREHADGWTVSTVDGSWAAHWEHTVAIMADGPWVLTAQDGGRAELGQRKVALSGAAASAA